MHVTYIILDMSPHASIEELDGPLLVRLQLLLETSSVTTAARRSRTSQPNMSRTLTRLRALFHDPLLEPIGRRMQLTPFARELRPRVAEAVALMRSLFDGSDARAPKTERRLFRIAATDYGVVAVLESRLRVLRSEAPGIHVRVEPLSGDSIGPLARGDLDLAIAPRVLLDGIEQFVFRKVHEDRLVAVCRKGHPLAPEKRLTLERYLAFEHVMIGNERPAPSAVQLALHRLGKTRNVVLTVPTFAAALAVVSTSDLMAALPESFVRRLGRSVFTAALPIPLDPLALNLVWHPRRTTDPIHKWLRETLSR